VIGYCRGLVDRLLELVYAEQMQRGQPFALFKAPGLEESEVDGSQFLEIAIGYVMTAPIRHRVKLNAVRELHVLVRRGSLLLVYSYMLAFTPIIFVSSMACWEQLKLDGRSRDEERAHMSSLRYICFCFQSEGLYAGDQCGRASQP